MKLLVTGATGLIGAHLCRHLVSRGHAAVAFSRRPERARRELPELSAAYAWQPENEAAPSSAFEDVDAVVHLAGESVAGRWSRDKKRRILESRERGTRCLVKALAAAPRRPRLLISASAIGYYGDRGDEELTEDSPPGDDFLARVCKAWEAEARRAEELGPRVVLLRTGIVLAAAGGAIERMLRPFKLGLGGPLGSGRQWWSWIHVEDVVGAIEHLMTGEHGGAFNLTSPSPVRQADFARALGRTLGRPALLPTPAFALKAGLGGFATELLSSKKVLPQRLTETGFRASFAELPSALESLLGKGRGAA